jgi:hypothetical protein
VKTNRFQAARGLPKLQLKPGSFVGTAAKADTKGNLTAQESRSLPGIGARHTTHIVDARVVNGFAQSAQ